MQQQKYITIGKAAKELGVSVCTLRRWDRCGKLRSAFRTLGKHRRYLVLDILKLKKTNQRVNIGYARVSSYDQKKDLQTQIKVLNQFAERQQVAMFSVMSDLGSGLNFKKKGLKQLISMILSSQIDTIYLTHKDRLLRFGNELITMIAKQFNTKVVVLYHQEECFETKLAKDVLEIITVFSARLYGSRSHKNKKLAVT
jgi:predicted site-specific integrase-resolvase